MRFFKKELISNRLKLPNGQSVRFEPVGTDTGLLATEDEALIAELEKAITRRVGGVGSLTQEEYDNLKKNPPVKAQRQRSFNAQSLQSLLTTQPLTQNGAQGVAVKPPPPSAPLSVPSGLTTVSSLRKLRDAQKAAATPIPNKPTEPSEPSAPIPGQPV